MMKTCCALVLVLLSIVVAASAQLDNPDPYPTTCCDGASARECTIYKNYDRKIRRTVPLSRQRWFAETENECYHLCKHVVEGCKAVNYMPKKNDTTKKEPNCEFMNVLAGQNEMEYYSEEDAPYISAVVNPSCDELDKGMYMKETYYRYQESFRTIEGAVAPAKDCVDECLKNETCYAYNYNRNTKTCTLMPGMYEIRKSTESIPITGLSCPYLANECTCS